MSIETADENWDEKTDLYQLPVLRAFEAQRSYPQVDVRVPASVQTRAGKTVTVTTRNISPDSLQIRCDGPTAAILTARGGTISKTNQPQVIVRFKLPGRNGPQAFAAVAKLTYMAVRKRGLLAFGVELTKFRDASDQERLRAFLMDAIQPDE